MVEWPVLALRVRWRSGGAGLAAAGQIGHYAGGDGGQGVGGWLGDGDGLEGDVGRDCCPRAPGGQEGAR